MQKIKKPSRPVSGRSRVQLSNDTWYRVCSSVPQHSPHLNWKLGTLRHLRCATNLFHLTFQTFIEDVLIHSVGLVSLLPRHLCHDSPLTVHTEHAFIMIIIITINTVIINRQLTVGAHSSRFSSVSIADLLNLLCMRFSVLNPSNAACAYFGSLSMATSDCSQQLH